MILLHGIARPTVPAWAPLDLKWRSDHEAPIHVGHKVRRPGIWERDFSDYDEALDLYFRMLDENPGIEYQLLTTVVTNLPGTHNITIPSDWASGNNSVGVLGSGASGLRTTGDKGGGGAGAWSSISNFDSAGGASISYIIGTIDSGTSSQFQDSSTLVATAALVHAGGATAGCVGTVKFAGGNGGSDAGATGSPTGGAGAAGPNGAGGSSADATTAASASGGGGANGGVSSVGAATSNASAGGANRLGTGGGAKATGAGATGGDGSGGGGGGGAASSTGTASCFGGQGSIDLLWSASGSFGPGGGGGACFSSAHIANGNTSNGYGAGGGGASTVSTSAAGSGTSGLLVLQYTPASFDLRRPTRQLYFHSRRH